MKITNYFLVLLLLLPLTIEAQLTRKPSPSREPNGAMAKKPDSTKRALNAIKSQADFDSMARVYHQNTPYALPHAMFIIDRRDKNKIYYVNSQKYRFHKDFLVANYMVLKGEDFFQNTYMREDRRFIVGTVAWQTPIKKFTFEFWEGDLIPANLIKQTYDIINKTFFEPIAFKPNSIRQDELSENLNINRISSDEISKNQSYLALNTAEGIGRIHIIDKLDDTVEIGYNEILILNEFPLNLPPVKGIIISQPSTPLSHINILAKGWNIPNAYIKNANELFKKYDGSWYVLETSLTDYKISPCNTKECIDNRGKINNYLSSMQKKGGPTYFLAPDSYHRMPPLYIDFLTAFTVTTSQLETMKDKRIATLSEAYRIDFAQSFAAHIGRVALPVAMQSPSALS